VNRRSLLVLLGGLALTSPVGAQAPSAAPSAAVSAQPEAIAIYDRARATVAARSLPAFIAYTEYAALLRHGKVQAKHTRVMIRTADGKVNATPIPDSPLDRIDTTPKVEARPLVYPTTTFGLVKRRAGEAPSTYESASTPQPSPEPSGPPVIGRVVSTDRDYDPTLVGIEQLDGSRVYHLKLAPRYDPQHHPIRDLWVDTATYDPRRIAVEVWAEAGPVRSRPTVVVDYAPIDGTWLIAHASTDFVLRFGFLSYGGSGEFRITDVTFPDSEPDWMFDAPALKQHLAQPAPGDSAPSPSP
jgi:hypothetical protein